MSNGEPKEGIRTIGYTKDGLVVIFVNVNFQGSMQSVQLSLAPKDAHWVADNIKQAAYQAADKGRIILPKALGAG